MTTIRFDVKEVREYLLKYGYVYTLRHPRSIGRAMAIYRVNTKGGSLDIMIGYVNITLIEEAIIIPDQLLPYAKESGLSQEFGDETLITYIDTVSKRFNTEKITIAKKWFNLASRLSGAVLNLYKAELMGERDVETRIGDS